MLSVSNPFCRETEFRVEVSSLEFLVPENCSELFRQLVLSLFIAHADCGLNKTGRIIDEDVFREYCVRGYWCAHLVRRPLSSY